LEAWWGAAGSCSPAPCTSSSRAHVNSSACTGPTGRPSRSTGARWWRSTCSRGSPPRLWSNSSSSSCRPWKAPRARPESSSTGRRRPHRSTAAQGRTPACTSRTCRSWRSRQSQDPRSTSRPGNCRTCRGTPPRRSDCPERSRRTPCNSTARGRRRRGRPPRECSGLGTWPTTCSSRSTAAQGRSSTWWPCSPRNSRSSSR